VSPSLAEREGIIKEGRLYSREEGSTLLYSKEKKSNSPSPLGHRKRKIKGAQRGGLILEENILGKR